MQSWPHVRRNPCVAASHVRRQSLLECGRVGDNSRAGRSKTPLSLMFPFLLCEKGHPYSVVIARDNVDRAMPASVNEMPRARDWISIMFCILGNVCRVVWLSRKGFMRSRGLRRSYTFALRAGGLELFVGLHNTDEKILGRQRLLLFERARRRRLFAVLLVSLGG